MSILFKSNNYSILDHGDYIDKLYKNVSLTDKTEPYRFMSWIFSIVLEKLNRKRNYDNRDFYKEVSVWNIFYIFLVNFLILFFTNNFCYRIPNILVFLILLYIKLIDTTN